MNFPSTKEEGDNSHFFNKDEKIFRFSLNIEVLRVREGELIVTSKISGVKRRQGRGPQTTPLEDSNV